MIPLSGKKTIVRSENARGHDYRYEKQTHPQKLHPFLPVLLRREFELARLWVEDTLYRSGAVLLECSLDVADARVSLKTIDLQVMKR